MAGEASFWQGGRLKLDRLDLKICTWDVIGLSRVGAETIELGTFSSRNRHQRLAPEIRLQSCNLLGIVHAFTLWH